MVGNLGREGQHESNGSATELDLATTGATIVAALEKPLTLGPHYGGLKEQCHPPSHKSDRGLVVVVLALAPLKIERSVLHRVLVSQEDCDQVNFIHLEGNFCDSSIQLAVFGFS